LRRKTGHSEKIDGGVIGQSTILTLWKFNAVSRQNSTASESTALLKKLFVILYLIWQTKRR